jgi:hypothetical protein
MGRSGGGKVPDGPFPSVLLLPPRVMLSEKSHPLISGRRSTICIYGLTPRRHTMAPAGGRWSTLATNLLPAERGYRNRLGGISLNPLVIDINYSHRFGKVGDSHL